MESLRSALAIPVLIFVLWLCSRNRRAVPWQTIAVGLLLQFVLAAALLNTSAGLQVFNSIGSAINGLMVSGNEAAKLLLNIDLLTKGQLLVAASLFIGLVFFCTLVGILSYIGLLQAITRSIARVMWWTMRVSGAEALAASANIFLGQTEAALMVRPMIPTLSRSELLAVMVGGMANVSFGMFPAYIALGIDPAHLLVASVISAPASLLAAKMLMPAAGASAGALPRIETHSERAKNILDAACRGASDGAALAVNVLAMLIAFISLASLADLMLGLIPTGSFPPLSFSKLLGWLFTPIAYLMGISMEDAPKVGALLGKKLFLNELVAYMDLGKLEGTISERSFVLSTYALCGFANFSSVAIQIGGLGGIESSRRGDFADLGLTALLGGTVATLLTAAVIGVLL